LLEGRGETDGRKLLRRAERMVRDIMAEPSKAGILPAYRHAQHLLCALLDSERIILNAGSDFDQGYELLDEAIRSDPQSAAQLDQIDQSASKSARVALERLGNKGHFE
jgi:hypothetical protein